MAELTWFGHACFRLKSRDVTLLFDPVGRQFGYDTSRLRPDIVTISHPHAGHNQVEALKNGFTLIDGPGEYEIRDVFVTGVRTYHDDANGANFGHNTVFVVHVEDLVICHLGDLGHTLSASQLEQIGPVDIVLIPAGGASLSPTKAAEVVSQLEPSVIVPMHYATSVLNQTVLEPLDKFAREFGLHDQAPRERLTIRRTDLPEEPQVIVLSDRAA